MSIDRPTDMVDKLRIADDLRTVPSGDEGEEYRGRDEDVRAAQFLRIGSIGG